MNQSTVALVAARNEVGLVGATVEAILTIPSVDRVVVVDDGSTDATSGEARAAGATVLVAPRHFGKGAVLENALARIPKAGVYLFLDADLGTTAKEAGVLLDAIQQGADVAIGVLPREPRHGGFRLVKRLAAAVIEELSGFRPTEPLSGQRAVRREVLDSVRPLAYGFGVEVAMTVDAVRLGFRVVEVPVEMRHEPTGRDLGGFLHRARQGTDLLAAAAPRFFRLR